MSITGQNIFDRAVQRSSLNDSTLLPTTESISYINTLQRKIYLLAARLNPEYFGKSGDTATRSLFTDSWDLSVTPGDVAAVTRVDVATITGSVSGVAVGDKLNLVSFRWPDLGVTPRVFIRGRKLFGYKTELGANSTNMVTKATVYYAELPPAISSLTTTLRLPDEWDALLYLPLARVFALRDKREEEAQYIDQEYAEMLQLFQEAVLVYDHGASRPLMSIPSIPLGGK